MGKPKKFRFEYINNNGSTNIKIAGTPTRIPTGSSEYTNSNNIYDLTGNVRDITMIAYAGYNRVSKGMGYYDGGNASSIIHYAMGGNTFSDLRLSSNVIYKIRI